MEHIQFFMIVFVALIPWVELSSLTTSLSLLEQHTIAKKLRSLPTTDLPSLYYFTSGLKSMGKEVNGDTVPLCQVANENLDKTCALSLMQYASVVKMLGCKDKLDFSLKELIADDIDIGKLANLIIAAGNLDIKLDDETVNKFISLAKENDSPKIAGSVFLAASTLPVDTADISSIVSMVEDIVAQADEVGGEVLQYEGGLEVTSQVLVGILALGDAQGKKLLRDEQAIKFGKYLVSRKYVFSLPDIHHLLVGLSALSVNTQSVPVVVSTFNSKIITSENPTLKVRVTNLLDQSIPDVTVSVNSFETADSDATALFKNKELQKSNDAEDFIVLDSEVAKGFVAANAFKLSVMDATPSRGMYNAKFEVGLKGGNKLLVLGGEFVLKVKVLAKIMVEGVEIGVGDKDHSSISKPIKLTFPEKVSKVLEADYHQKLVMTFNLKDIINNQLVTVHQTFIRLVHETTKQEIFFVAEADNNDNYKFILDVGATGKDSFNNLSGRYKMSLIVGDNAMQIPISWSLGDIILTFAGETKTTKRQERITEPKPTIEHMFRIPEKRPPKLVSTAFTILTVSPMLIMFVVWAKAGANVDNFSFSLATVVFHVGLCGIFALYYMFWIKFDMFYTMKLLGLIGGITFVGGNKMLANMAASRYKS